MNKKWLHKFIGKLNRNDGAAILAIVALVLMMTVMGGVFASIMGGWKTSAPNTVNSIRAAQLANSAATYAVQKAKNDIGLGGGTLICGNRLVKVPVVADDGNGGSSYYWIECPGIADDETTGIDDDIVDDDGDDNVIADDVNFDGISDVYTVIATGKVEKGVTVLARRQVKAFVELVDPTPLPVVIIDVTNPNPGVAN